jgi:hypothetical protein
VAQITDPQLAPHALGWGRRFRILAIIDDFTREALALAIDTPIGGRRLTRELDALIARPGSPARIALENNGKIRPQPDRENAFARSSGGGTGTGAQ